jgi:hypothetical protein
VDGEGWFSDCGRGSNVFDRIGQLHQGMACKSNQNRSAADHVRPFYNATGATSGVCEGS